MRTTCSSLKRARKASVHLFDRIIAAPPQRNRMFCSRKARSLPWYRLWVRFSVDTMSAVELGLAASMFFTSSMDTTPAEQPMPERL